jgi:hypothetical protein
LETASCRNAGKGYVHKTQCGETLPQTLRKWELCAPGCTFYKYLGSHILFLVWSNMMKMQALWVFRRTLLAFVRQMILGVP